MIKIGSRVMYVKVDTEEDQASGYYPPIGTLGTVKYVDDSSCYVKWDEGTAGDGTWWCDFVAIEKVQDADMDLSTFALIADNRKDAYISHIEFELGFDNPELRDLITFKEFCKELDLGYGNSAHIQIARLYEDEDGKIWYDNEYVQ